MIVIIFILFTVVYKIVSHSQGQNLTPEDTKETGETIYPKYSETKECDNRREQQKILIKSPDKSYYFKQSHDGYNGTGVKLLEN